MKVVPQSSRQISCQSFRPKLAMSEVAQPWSSRWRWPIALSALMLSLSLTPPALAQAQQLRTLTVTGRGGETVQTTLAQVRLGVEVQGKTAQEVQQQVARRSAAVVALLRSRNVEKLETTGINLNPNYSFTNNRQQLIGYSGSNIVSFRVPTERAGALLDEAVQAGATRIDSLAFVAPDPAISAAQKQALREATQDAQAQARAVLEALNLTPGQIVRIQINGANVPPPRPLPLLDRAALKAEATTPVIGGEQDVEASVTLEISY